MFCYSSTAQTDAALSDFTGHCVSGGSPQILPGQRKNMDGNHEKNSPAKVLMAAATGAVHCCMFKKSREPYESKCLHG